MVAMVVSLYLLSSFFGCDINVNNSTFIAFAICPDTFSMEGNFDQFFSSPTKFSGAMDYFLLELKRKLGC